MLYELAIFATFSCSEIGVCTLNSGSKNCNSGISLKLKNQYFSKRFQLITVSIIAMKLSDINSFARSRYISVLYFHNQKNIKYVQEQCFHSLVFITRNPCTTDIKVYIFTVLFHAGVFTSCPLTDSRSYFLRRSL